MMWTESALAHSIVVSNFYTEGKIIRPEILKEQQNAHLQTSFKQESNSKTMQVLSEVTRPHPSKTCLVWENFTIYYEY